MRRNYWNYTPFSQISRHKQRDAYIRLRWRILQKSHLYGGLFTSHLVLDEPDRPALFNQWFDFLFLGEDGHTIWNATVTTAQQEFWNRVRDIAWDRSASRLSAAERESEFRMELEPVHYAGVRKCYQLKQRPEREYDAFGGMTFREYEEKLSTEILEKEPPEIRESYRLDSSYRYGIGVAMVVDTQEIDRHAIERAIRRFREIGEVDWENPVPVPRGHLPSQTENEAFAALKKQMS